MSDTPTPRTDAAMKFCFGDDTEFVKVDFARQLERELNDLKSTKTDMQTTNIPEIVDEPAKMGCAPGNETIGYFAAEISRLRGELVEASRFKAAWDDFAKHIDRAHKILDGKGFGKNVLEAALDEIEELRKQRDSLDYELANESLALAHMLQKRDEMEKTIVELQSRLCERTAAYESKDVERCLEISKLNGQLAKARVRISLLESTKNEMHSELAEARAALSGRTVSCGACNKLAKEIEELKRQSRFTMPPGDGWVYTDQLSHEVSTPGPEIKWTGIEEEVKP